MTTTLSAVVLVIALAAHLWWMVRRSRREAAQHLAADLAAVRAAIGEVRILPDDAAGVRTFAGRFEGSRIQVRTIVDTLATRKLPALWLSVSVTEPTAVDATLDMMMRPSSATTFSNFDSLRHGIRPPPGFPDEAIIRTDRPGAAFPFAALAGHLGIFKHPAAKELLIKPAGVRIVWLIAEADRARYGVFRQADFGDAAPDAGLIRMLAEEASAIRNAINKARVAA